MFSKATYLNLLFAMFIAAFVSFSTQVSYSQVIDPGDGGQGGGVQNNNQNGGGVQGNGAGGREGGLEFDEPRVNIEISDDTRNQGFVGATTNNIVGGGDTGYFIGAASEESGPPLDSTNDASFGGGGNDFNPITSGGGGGTGRQGGGFNGAGGTTNIITRRNIRAKLTPSFYAPRPSANAVSNRFQSRFNRQPGSSLAGNGYSISVEGRTAFVNGSVSSRADSERIVRQLRLEPGVYNIVNRLSISQNQQPISTNTIPGNGFSAPAMSTPAASPPSISNQIVQPGITIEPQVIPFNQTPVIQPVITQPVISQPQIITQPQGIIVAPNQFQNF